MAKHYPDGSFFGIALLLFAASLVPGYLLLAMRVRSKSHRPNVDSLLEDINEVPATRSVHEATQLLQELTHDADQLRKTVRTLREGLGEELQFATTKWNLINRSNLKDVDFPSL